jgi:hypothetical protein
MSCRAVIPREVVDGFNRLRAVTLEAWSADEIIREIDALERTVFAVVGATPPGNRPVIPTKDERWG